MNLIELYVPRGRFDDDGRRRLAESLTRLIDAPGAPADIIRRGQEMTSVVVHEPSVWTVGGQAVSPEDDGRFIARLTVPGGHVDDGMRAEIVRRVTALLAEHATEATRLYDEPRAWVQIVELPDGHAGVLGRAMPNGAFVDYAVAGTWPAIDEVPDGAVVDPICGMAVDITAPGAITVERDGTTHGFCSATCRDLFVASAA